MQRFGIDISKWQGNFKVKDAIKNAGIEYAIIKIGGGDNTTYKDSKFENYYQQCVECNLPKGCYFFGHALNMNTAKKEVDYWLNLMKGKRFEYPVFYDVEGAMLKLDKRTLTDIIKYVCSTVEANGYWCGIYTSLSHFNNLVYDNELKPYSHWVACYSKNMPLLKSGSEVQMWQFGGETNYLRSNRINGVVVDQDYCYIDYPTYIINRGLNGYGDSSIGVPKEEKPSVLDNDEIARQVIAGKWGNGTTRKTKLTEAGYDYKEIQRIVNEMLK